MNSTMKVVAECYPQAIIFAKHDGSEREFLFAVPPNLRVQKDDILLVNTMRGPALATATSEVIIGPNINELATRFGAYLPLKTVRAAATKEICEYIESRAKEKLHAIINNAILSDLGIPF